jgi:catechol 2,3-dioxygenase-like lactoylglutathione lyase family enzyme
VLTRIDHVMFGVPDLAKASETYTRLGFNVQPGGAHIGVGTHNAIAFLEEDYIELLGVRDPDELRVAAAVPGSPFAGLVESLARGGGFLAVIVQSDDLAADVAAMRQRGVDVSNPAVGERRTPDGQTLRWQTARLGPANPLPLIFIQHLTPLAERRQAARGGNHPNGVRFLERVYVSVPDVIKSAEVYARVLGMPVPKTYRGTVIMAEMAVFELGPTGLSVAQAYAPGPAAEALKRQGPGPFQVLYRTSSMDAAARFMVEHGMPPPVRGTRNTGEQAMLVEPANACNVYVGFVGPA